MMAIKKTALGIIGIICIFFLFLAPPCDPETLSGALAIENIHELKIIEVKLAWQEQYDSTAFFDALFPKAYAVLPPDFQPHYKHKLQFNHPTQTITDIYQHFTGPDRSTMITSEVIRDRVIYNKFKTFLEKKEFFHKVTRKKIVGPSRAVITFINIDNSTASAYFYGENVSGRELFELSSKEFSMFLASLRENR